MAAILDPWSRRVVGYAISRSMDARLAVAALMAAIRARQPPKGCIHHSDLGSQYASEVYRGLLAEHGLVGSMGRRGNPYDTQHSSRTTMPGTRSKPPPKPVHYKGRTPIPRLTGSILHAETQFRQRYQLVTQTFACERPTRKTLI
jgi:transposase InsO family protein